jgi:predicted phage terminase large subunit-like protein
MAYAARDRRDRREESDACERDLATFIRHAWKVLKPEERYKHNWHIDAICDKLMAVSRGEIKRLQIWIPPGTSKSLTVSVFWPAWEWTTNPWLRYFGASYQVGLAGHLAAMSRDLMMGTNDPWYPDRWGHVFKFEHEGEHFFDNDKGGTRLATAPNAAGSGEHGHRIIIDDPINAKAVDATSAVTLNETNSWYDSTVVSRGIGNDHARVIIMQRLHENDLAGHVLEKTHWEILCLPERYEPSHQFVWPHDPRQVEGELLWPAHRGEMESDELAAGLTPHRAAGQLQQRPSAKEGDLLQSSWWRFYDPRIRSMEEWDKLPAFSMVVQTMDCPLKDKETNDNVAIQIWGVHGVQRYLLDLRLGKMSYPQAKRAAKEMALWARRTWPRARHVFLIEGGGYGSDLHIDLKMELTGMTKVSPAQDGDKVVRADRASDSLESGHCFLPGCGPPWRPPVYEAGQTPADVADFIHNCAAFPNAPHDDDVDAWSQFINWLRGKQTRPMRSSSPSKMRRRTQPITR